MIARTADPRRVRETEDRLARTVRDLEPLLKHLEQSSRLLAEATALARELSAQRDGHIGGTAHERELAHVARRAHLLARQVVCTSDQLENVLSDAPEDRTLLFIRRDMRAHAPKGL